MKDMTKRDFMKIVPAAIPATMLPSVLGGLISPAMAQDGDSIISFEHYPERSNNLDFLVITAAGISTNINPNSRNYTAVIADEVNTIIRNHIPVEIRRRIIESTLHDSTNLREDDEHELIRFLRHIGAFIGIADELINRAGNLFSNFIRELRERFDIDGRDILYITIAIARRNPLLGIIVGGVLYVIFVSQPLGIQ